MAQRKRWMFGFEKCRVRRCPRTRLQVLGMEKTNEKTGTYFR